MADDAYQKAVVKGHVMQILLQEWWTATDETRDPNKLNDAMMLKAEIERTGFPVDWSVYTFYSSMNPGGDSVSIGVFVRRPPKDGTPTQHKLYDDWFRKIQGISHDEFPHDPDEK